jgi:hydrogenase expression/formation protein HypD
MKALVDDGVQLNGYICPGHVSTITGTSIYREIVDRYGIGCVISGFEPTDLLETILMLVKQMESGQPALEIQYARAVRPEGNTRALEIMYEVFEPTDEWWRGLGVISQSGLRLRDKYRPLDAAQRFDIEVPEPAPDGGCICGEILKGLKSPLDCPLFAKVCTPADPVGACMVSGEGSCQAYYRYHVEK